MARDEERAILKPEELHGQKRIKCFGYIAIFVLFQVGVFAALALTVLYVKSPKIKINVATVGTMNVTSRYFKMALIAQVSIENKNWGAYKFDNGTLSLLYRGIVVGEAQIPKRKVKARGTRRMNVTVEVSSERVRGKRSLSSDLNSGNLMLESYTKLRGKVLKRSRTGEMNCTMSLDTNRERIQGIKCK